MLFAEEEINEILIFFSIYSLLELIYWTFEMYQYFKQISQNNKMRKYEN